MATKSHQCLSCLFKSARAIATPSNGARSFSSSPRQLLRKRPSARFPNVKAADMGLLESRQPEVDALAEHLRPYTEKELEILALKYSPKQMEAIKRGEAAVDAGDMMQQGRFRSDPMRIDYVDDFSSIRNTLDQPSPRVLEKHKKKPDERELTPRQKRMAEDAADPNLIRLSQQTGMLIPQIKSLRVKNLVSHRVVNQTRMGKISSMYFLTVAGNENGMLGIGEGKSAEDEDGKRQAMLNAIRNMKPVPRYEDRTIFGSSEAKVGASIVQLSTRPPGFGNRCQSLIYELARAAGISDLAARTPRSRNKMNVCKAAFKALTEQRLPEDIARARGRKMVDVRRVYYGGKVH